MISRAHRFKESRGEEWNGDYKSLLPNSAEAWGTVTLLQVDPGQSPDCDCGGETPELLYFTIPKDELKTIFSF